MQQQPAQVENPAVQVLREALLPFQRVPGVHVVLDTAPFAGALQEAALVVADHVIVPGIPERATESGLMDIARTLNRLDRAIMGVVPTKIVRSGSGETEHERTIQDWRNALGPVVYYDPGADLHGLPRRVIWGQLVRYGLPIWDVAPFCDAAQEMSAVLRRIAYDAKIEKAS
jgi:cellulose biosynthesis protein BcsQ